MPRLYKPLPIREAEAANPPPLREILDFPAANRIANVIIETLDQLFCGTEAGVHRFLTYLLHNYGTDTLNIEGEYSYGNVGLLKAHIRFQAKSSLTLCCFLDYFRDFAVSHLKARHPSWPRNLDLMPQTLEGMALISGLTRLNESLEHDACVYRLDVNMVFKIGSEVLQKHAISPALQLLRESGMEEALGEYNDALVEWAQGRTDDAILHSSHAVESVMKFILKDMNIPIKDTATPSALILEITKANILPESYKDFWDKLNQGIQGVITIRNKAPGAGHGPAPGARPPDRDLAEYAVNLAGSNILFLIRRWRDIKRSSVKFDPLAAITKALGKALKK
jgi:HEPN domain-containing protein